MLLTLRVDTSVSTVVRTVHSLFGRECRRMTKIRGRIWQRRFYDHVIRDEKDLRTKLDYLHGNPVRSGIIEDPVEYQWSSLSFWATGTGRIPCDHWNQ
jgi:putative transposase